MKLTRRRKQLLREMGLSEDLDSAELAERLHAQVRVNRGLSRTIEEKDGELARMDFVLSVRDKEIAAKDARIAELEAKLSALEHGKIPVPKTSANSSVPPSKNPIGVPHTQSQRKPSGKKTGGQKGHPGSTRLQSDNVTATERWYPAAVYPECGRPLDMDTATVCSTRQVIDIPFPILAEVYNHHQMQVKCSCGHCCKVSIRRSTRPGWR